MTCRGLSAGTDQYCPARENVPAYSRCGFRLIISSLKKCFFLFYHGVKTMLLLHCCCCIKHNLLYKPYA